VLWGNGATGNAGQVGADNSVIGVAVDGGYGISTDHDDGEGPCPQSDSGRSADNVVTLWQEPGCLPKDGTAWNNVGSEKGGASQLGRRIKGAIRR